MATFIGKGYFQGYNGTHFYLELWYQIISQNVTTNKTTFQLLTYVGSQDGYSAEGNYTEIMPYSDTPGIIDNTKNCGYYTKIPRNSRVGPGYSEYYTVTHNAQGKCSLSVSASTNCNWGGLGYAWAGGTIVFKDIPRASSVSATNAVVEGSTTINITRAVDTFKHTLSYSFDGLTGEIATNVDTSYSWIIPSDFYQKLSTTDYTVGKSCTITCETFNGNTSLGTKTTTINITVDANSNTVKPVVDGTITLDSTTKSLNGNVNDRIIKGMTDATITIIATPQSVQTNPVTITSKSVVCGDGKSLTDSGTLNDVESGTFVISAVDSRGVPNSTTKTLILVEYVTLSLNPTFYRTSPTNNTIALTFTGNYFNDKFGTASSTANTLTVKYRYKLSTSSTWGNYATLSTTLDGNTFSNGSSPIILGTNFDYTKQYDFEIQAIDRISTVTRSVTVTEGIPVFDWGKNDFQFHVPIKQASGNNVLDYTTVEGDAIQLGSKYVIPYLPVGSVFITANNSNPSSYFGGTWVLEQNGVGEVITGTNSSTQYKSSWTNNSSIELGAGTYLIMGTTQSTNSGKGITLRFSDDTNIRQSYHHSDGNVYSGQLMEIVTLTQTTTIYLQSWCVSTGNFALLKLVAYKLYGNLNGYYNWKRTA